MKSTETKTTQREKRKAGLSALLRDDLEETANESLPVHKSPMTLKEISDAENLTPENVKQTWFIGDEKEENPNKKELPHEIRVTLQMPAELHKKIKIMAHWELTSLKDIINASLEATILEYEKTHGQLANIPKSQRKK